VRTNRRRPFGGLLAPAASPRWLQCAAPRRAPRRCAFAQPLIWIETLPRGVPGHTIHPPRSDRARAMVRRHLSCGRRDEGEGRNRITRKGRTAGSRHDKPLADKALHAKTKIKLTPTFLRRARAAAREHRACNQRWLNLALRSAPLGRASSPRAGVPYRRTQRRENRRERRRDERAQLAH
jgi:hypothetical protein